VPFHVTCPISKTATVTVTVRPAPEFAITQIEPGLGKLTQSLRRTSGLLELEPLEVRVEHWSDLDIGKVGSSTADIVAAARALAAACDRTLSPGQLAKLATSIESSDGSMYPGLVAFNQKTGDVLEQFSWWPQFVILMITPAQAFNTESADFGGKHKLGTQFDDLLASLRTAAAERDTAAFARAATESARINQRFVPNPFHALLEGRARDLGAVGVNVGHTGTVLGLLFGASDPAAMKTAATASLEIQRILPRPRRSTSPSPRLPGMSVQNPGRQGGDLRGPQPGPAGPEHMREPVRAAGRGPGDPAEHAGVRGPDAPVRRCQ